MLRGLRILDLTRVVAGPFATAILADLGAEVIKIERPKTGDDYRHGPAPEGETSLSFQNTNRGKRSLTLDFRAPEGREILLRLVDGADALVENFRAGYLARCGLGAEVLKARNPRLVVASLSGFGQTGPRAGEPSYDIVAQAAGGLLAMTGSEGGPPLRGGGALADFVGGLYLALGIAAGLLERERTGRARALDLSNQDCVFAITDSAASIFSAIGARMERVGNQHPFTAPYECLETTDGWVVVGTASNKLFRKLVTAIGRPELGRDPRFGHYRARAANRREINGIVAAWARPKSTAEVLAALGPGGADVPCARVASPEELIHDPQLLARGMVERHPHPTLGEVVFHGNALRFSGAEPRARARARARRGQRRDPGRARHRRCGARRAGREGRDLSRLALLRDPSFARVFAARCISAFGTAMTPVALPFAVLENLGGTPRDVGLVVAAGSGAQILVQLFGGALADRGSRRRQMVGADALAALAQAALATLLLSGSASLPALIALQTVIGVSFAMHFPAAVGLVPLVVPREQLQPANALLSIAHSTALGLGAAAGGFLAARFGAGTALAVDAASFAASALLVAGVRAQPQVRTAAASLWAALRAGWREFTAHRWLWTIVLQFTVMTIGWFGTFAVVGPVVAQRSLGGADAWGAIAAAYGFGLVLGGFVALRVTFRRPMLVATLTCFGAVLLPLLLVGPSPLGWIAAAAFVAGAGHEVFGVLWNTTLHTRVAPAALSRVSAYDAVGSIALVPLGQVLAGLSVESYGAPVTLLWAAAAIVVPTAAVLLVPEVRNLRNGN